MLPLNFVPLNIFKGKQEHKIGSQQRANRLAYGIKGQDVSNDFGLRESTAGKREEKKRRRRMGGEVMAIEYISSSLLLPNNTSSLLISITS